MFASARSAVQREDRAVAESFGEGDDGSVCRLPNHLMVDADGDVCGACPGVASEQRCSNLLGGESDEGVVHSSTSDIGVGEGLYK